MPAISDPGEDLVREARKAGIEIESVPGPSAVITAISISGFPCGRFCFEGFLSMNKISRRNHLEALKNESRTMVFYEAPHKLQATLRDMLKYFGNREIALVRELTKIHETVLITTLEKAVEYYEENTPKGEFVLIIKGVKPETEEYSLEDAVKLAERFMTEGMATSAAAKQAAEITNIKKGDIYKSLIK
jgi:16S rRNA (cytidine1402-2'-O)-methyltransferase